MGSFIVKDIMGRYAYQPVMMPFGSTPNDFKKIANINEKRLPTVCRITQIGKKPKYLSRVNEWDSYIVKDEENCEFIIHPNGEAAAVILISVAISIAIGVATYLLTPRPNLGLNQHDQDVSPTFDLTQQGNRIRLNQPVPIHYGTIRSYPDVASNPWTETVDNKRFYHVLLNMGFRYIEIDDLRIDDTDLSTFIASDWAYVNYRYPGDSPTALFLQPVITSKEVKNVTIEDTDSGYYVLNDTSPSSLVEDIHLDFVNARGLYYTGGMNDAGVVNRATATNIDLASLPATIDGAVVATFLVFGQNESADNGAYNWTGLGLAATRILGLDSVGEFQNGSVYVNDGTYSGQRFRNIVRIISMGDPKIFVDYSTAKTINETAIWIRVTIQEIDNAGADVDSAIVEYHKIQGASREPFYTQFDYSHGTPARLKIQVIQGYMYTTDSPLTSHFVPETSYETLEDVSNKTEWIGIRGDVQDAEPLHPDETMIEIMIQASAKLNNENIGIFNSLGKRRLAVYDFDALSWSTIQTNSPIWAFYDIVTDIVYGMGLDGDDYLDLNNLEDIHDSIDGLDLECNTRFDTSMSANEMIAQICQTMRCIKYERGGKLLLARDEIKSSINGFFSRENIKQGSLSIELVPKNQFSATWYKVTYYDSITSKKETLDAVIPSALSAADQYEQPFEEIELHCVTSRLEAWKIGVFLAAQNKYRNELIRFSTDAEGFFPNPMDNISVSHPMLTSTQTGYIQKVDGAIIYLSEPIIFNGYETGFISFKSLNGTCSNYYICKPGVNQYSVELVEFDTATENFNDFPFLSQEDAPETEETTFTFGLTESSMICVVKGITADGENGATIEAVNHNPIVFMFEKAIHLLPDLGGDYKIWDEFIIEPLDCIVNLATKTITVRWTGGGFNSYNVKYLFNNLGIESTYTDNVVQGAPNSTHTSTYVYIGEAPSRILIVPAIDITISPPSVEDVDFMAKIVPIEFT